MPNSPQQIAVIGDIHGCIHTLEKLYRKLSGEKFVYSVGDLVDRGKYSKEVVAFAIENGIKTVKGNHEDMMLKAVENSDKLLSFMNKETEHYYSNGGRETQYSYIGSKSFKDVKKFGKKLKTIGHYEFAVSMPLKYEFKKAVISHAGIITDGNDITILWNRREPAFIEKLQIHGHTPLKDFSFKPNHFINIDTGCVYGNKLTAVIIDTNLGKVIEVIQENCDPKDTDG